MPFEAFQERDYRRFWVSQFISNIGSWMQTVAQGWLVYRLTDSPFLLGFVGFASSIPALLLMLPGGVLADQFNRKRVVAISQIAQAGAALWLSIAIYLHHITVWQIVAAALLVGIAQSFSSPAWQAMVVDLLEDRSRLPNAVAMNSLQFNISRVVGPLLAGLTLSAWGPFWCFFLNAVSFVPLIWVLYLIRSRQQPLEDKQAMIDRFAEGLRYVRTQHVIMLLLAIVAAASLFGYPYLNLMPIVARNLYTNDAQGMAWLMGAVGVGALLGALSLSIRTPDPRHMMPAILGCFFAFALGLGLVGVTRSVPAVLVLFMVCGFAMVTCLALVNTSIQRRIPDAMRGRVLSMYTFAFSAFYPFGNLAAGIVAEKHGIDFTLRGLGLAMLFCAALATGAAAFMRPALRVRPATIE